MIVIFSSLRHVNMHLYIVHSKRCMQNRYNNRFAKKELYTYKCIVYYIQYNILL